MGASGHSLKRCWVGGQGPLPLVTARKRAGQEPAPLVFIAIGALTAQPDTLENVAGGQVGNLPHWFSSLSVRRGRIQNTNVDAARLEARATSLYFSATSFFTRSSRALPWSPEAITSEFSFST